ncbi:uncharacterized protein LOC131802327 [Musca domestica]|uniref:Uncharacterized protein LOC131802327 n=1 Tax=Musca domestica TaxID=7370 RepID=A0ABM3UY06_MUSDO|nr:uncharacterized protein LOC131802327 [Musca domestica]
MSETNDKFSTPIQTKSKSLGLKRNSSSVSKQNCNTTTTPVISAKKKAIKTSKQEPQSDVKINYRNLETGNSNDSVLDNGTPSTPVLLRDKQQLHRECVSTNCRPYRLSLSKRIREKMTKKRLEFHMANEMEKQEEEETQEQCDLKDDRLTKHSEKQEKEKSTPNGPAENMTRTELLSSIDKLQKELKSREEHAKKVQELKQAIEVWKNGFASALNDLQSKITPHYEKEVLLQHLHISEEMLKFIND